MTDKLVMWAADAQDKKCLIAIELIADENSVTIYKFPGESVTEEFYQTMFDKWKKGEPVEFIKPHEVISRPLTVTDDLLPEDLKVDRPELIVRAKAEWHFVVLSAKLYELYHGEITDLKEKVDQASEYTQGMWEEAKGFWNKVQGQIRENNMFRDHATELKKTTNEVFDQLKEMRKVMDNKFKEASKDSFAFFNEKIDEINKKVDEGKGLQPLFNELKSLQKKFTSASFTRDDRNKVWNYIDSTFKKIKEKKYGDTPKNANSAVERLENRYQGLVKAIDRMQFSIHRDQKDKGRETDYVSRSEGQLESELRKAKIMMIDERINSKQAKLDDMLATKTQLEAKIKKEKDRAQKIEEKKILQEKKAEKKAEIAERIVAESKEVIAENETKLEQAAAQLKEAKKDAKSKSTPPAEAKKEEVIDSTDEKPESNNLIENISESVEEITENVVKTTKNIAAKIADTIEDVVDSISGEEE